MKYAGFTFVIAAAALMAVGNCHFIETRTCREIKDHTGTLSGVSIVPCRADPCVFKKHKNYTIEINFKPNMPCKRLTGEIGLKINDHRWITFNAEFCDHIFTSDGKRAKCPILHGHQPLTLKFEGSVPSILPTGLKISVRVTIVCERDLGKKVLLCMEFDVVT